MNFAYKCKFCGKPGIVTGDDEGLKTIKPEIWLPKICCNRCGDFMVAKRRVTDAIARTCRMIINSRFKPLADRAESDRDYLACLTAQTKRYAHLACEYHRLTNVWDEAFPRMLFEQPDKAGIALKIYLRGLAKEAKTHQKPV